MAIKSVASSIVVRGISVAHVAVDEHADVDVFENTVARIGNRIVDPHEVVEVRVAPLKALLANEQVHRFVLGIDLDGLGLVVGVPAAQHLLRYGGEVLVDESVAVVVSAVEPLFVDRAVAVVVGVGVGQPVAAQVTLAGIVDDVDGIDGRPELELVGRRRNGGHAPVDRADPQTGGEQVFDAAARGPLGRRSALEGHAAVRHRSEHTPVGDVEAEVADVVDGRSVDDEHPPRVVVAS